MATREAPGRTGTTLEVENPATGEVIATVPKLGAEEVRALVDRARAAQPAWEALGTDGRGEVLLRAALARRELGAGDRDDRLRDREELGRRRVLGGRLRGPGARVLASGRAGVSRGRGGRDSQPARARAPAPSALRPAWGRRRYRTVELPAHELVRRLHPGARRRQLGAHSAPIIEPAEVPTT
jgi:Aldehyde dehydrogenase family